MKLNVFRKVKLVEDQPPKKEIKHHLTDTNSKFVWTKGSDVMKTFKRYGFIPPSEYRNDYLFKKNRDLTNE
jgi:hypothetical protein